MEKVKYTCKCCGIVFEEIPLCFGNEYPDYYLSVPVEERAIRIEIIESLCVIDDHFFHRGQLIIPIIDFHENLIFNVWTSISRENFELRNDLWNEAARVKQTPYFGWLQTHVDTYDQTVNIKTMAYESEVGHIPTIEVIEETISYDTIKSMVLRLKQLWLRLNRY